MFYTQSLSGKIRKFDYGFNTGSQCDIKIEYKLKGQILDGVAIDSEDKLWVALWSEGKAVCINTKLQKVILSVDAGSKQTSAVAFG